jgi:hypothetical protein
MIMRNITFSRVISISTITLALVFSACTKGSVDLGSNAAPDSLGSCDGEGGGGPQPHAILDPPGVDASKAIADLTDAEAEAWCTWFVNLSWFGSPPGPVPADRTVDADGTVAGYEGSIRGAALDFSDAICIVRPSIDHCVANLRLEGCSATVHELDACAESLIFECVDPRPWCTPYLDTCSQTIVLRPSGSPRDCRLPVQ